MSDDNQPLITDQERGVNLTRGKRLTMFISIAIAIIVATAAIAFVSDRLDSASKQRRPQAPVVTSTPTVLALSTSADDEPARIVEREDRRIWRAVGGTARGKVAAQTVVLNRRDGAYSLDDLVELGAARRNSARIATVTKHVVLRSGARLNIHEPGLTLNLVSTPTTFTSIVAWGGTLSLRGSASDPLTVRSWSPDQGASDHSTRDGRAYLRAHSGRLDLRDAHVSRLGFWSGRTGGIASTGTSLEPGTATLQRAQVEHNHVGLYLMNSHDARVTDTTLAHSQRHGIQIDRSPGTVITRGDVTDSGNNGIHAHDHSDRIWLRGTRIESNRGYAVQVNGRAQASGPNTQGYSVRNAQTLKIESIHTRDNTRGGLRITGTNKTSIKDASITEPFRPIHVIGPSRTTLIEDNQVTSMRGAVILLTDNVDDATITGNTLDATTSGVWASNSDVQISRNEVTVRSGHALVFGENVTGTARDNTFAGKGPGAIAWHAARGVEESGNTSKAWDTTHPAVDWLEKNPFALLWIIILLVPAIGINFVIRRVRQHRDLRRLTEETVIAMTRARRMAELGIAPTTSPEPTSEPGREPSPAPAPEPMPEPEPTPAPSPEPEPEPVPTPEPVRAPTPPRAPQPTPHRVPQRVPAAAAAPAHVDRQVRRGAMGQFLSAQDLAVHAVLEGGRSPEHVARTLQVTPAQVRLWVHIHLRGDEG